MTRRGSDFDFPPFFEGSCRRRWGSGISLKQGTLIEKWIPGFMCVTYRSRESITKYPTGLQERNLVYVVDIEISLAKLFNTALVAEDEEDLV